MHPPSVEQSDLPLVRRAARGDPDAQRALFERYREMAYRVAFRVTGRNEDALDVVQDSFIKAFDSLGSFEGGSASFKTWFLRIVTNRGLDLLRSRKVRMAVPLAVESEEDGPGAVIPADPDADAASAGLEQAELAARLREAIEALSPDHRAVFAMYATGDMTYQEIAETLDIPIGTVMSRLFHARKRLQELLRELKE